VVYGDDHSYLVALVTLDPDELDALAEHGLTPEQAAQEAIDAANERFARIEQIKRFGILDHDLTQAGGELTPTMKVKRGVVYEMYRDAFEALYEEVGS
jgi:long-chain acyl-CoA synthetase